MEGGISIFGCQFSCTFDIDKVQDILQTNLHDYFNYHFSDKYYHLKELEMFIYEFYVNDELIHMMIGYEIAIFLQFQGARDVGH